MMKIFEMQVMNNRDYNNYMCGGYQYTIKTVWVKAETKEEAIATYYKAHPRMVVNENCVEEVKE